jgi:hypothetical protein
MVDNIGVNTSRWYINRGVSKPRMEWKTNCVNFFSFFSHNMKLYKTWHILKEFFVFSFSHLSYIITTLFSTRIEPPILSCYITKTSLFLSLFFSNYNEWKEKVYHKKSENHHSSNRLARLGYIYYLWNIKQILHE